MLKKKKHFQITHILYKLCFFKGYLKDILHEICRYNSKGTHKNTWELKEEYKQGDQSSDVKKKVALEKVSLEKDSSPGKEDFMDDDDMDDDDFDDDDMDDDDME